MRTKWFFELRLGARVPTRGSVRSQPLAPPPVVTKVRGLYIKTVLKQAMERCSGAFWVEGSPRTVLKCFDHDVDVTGLPVRQAPYRLKGQDQDALERCVAEDVLGGQLVPGEGDEQCGVA